MRQSNRGVLLLAAVTACSHSRPREDAASAAPSASSSATAPLPVTAAPSSAPLRLPRMEGPAAESGKASLWMGCADGFSPGTEPSVDVGRLSLLCGPVNGMSIVARTSGVLDEGRKAAAFIVPTEKGDCFRIFAVVAEPADDLEVEVLGKKGERLLLENQNRRFILAPGEKSLCTREPVQLEVRFSTHGGHAPFAAAIWRGVHMMPRKKATP